MNALFNTHFYYNKQLIAWDREQYEKLLHSSVDALPSPSARAIQSTHLCNNFSILPSIPRNKIYVFFFQPHMHARISMSELNEQEDRSMIAYACDAGARRVLFFSDVIYSGHYLESLALFLWRVL